MFALVRFLDLDHAHDTRLYVVRVDDIRDFHPKHETDFDGKAVYVVHWVDEVDGDDTGDYKAQIFGLGVEDLQHRRQSDIESSTVQATKETAKATRYLGAY
ncbi:hypothetical protein MTO96_046741 [Rhipicephalus appendiculatus]